MATFDFASIAKRHGATVEAVPAAAPASSFDFGAIAKKHGGTIEAGRLEAGNIDLFKQPSVPNPKGGRSTVQSFSVNLDGREVLLPTVMPDGRLLSEDDAIKEYKKTGKHLGIFADPDSATAYAKQLHEDYAAGKYRPPPMKADGYTNTASVRITQSGKVGQPPPLTASSVTPEMRARGVKGPPANTEAAFRKWYAEQAKAYDLNPDPDSQPYDYRAAYRAGATPDDSGHWPSQFKKAGHPNEIVGGFNTRTGERVPGTPRAKDAAALVALGWDAATAEKLAATPEPQAVATPTGPMRARGAGPVGQPQVQPAAPIRATGPAPATVVRQPAAPTPAARGVTDFAENAVRSLGAGALRFNIGFWGGLQAAGDALGLTSVSEWAAEAGNQASEMAAITRGEQEGAGPTEQAVYGGFESMGLSVPALAAGAVTGNPATVLALFGGVTGGDAYRTAREKGLEVPAALSYAVSQGAIEAATEKIPASRLLADLAKKTGFLKTITRQLVTEIPGEQVATLLQDLNDWAAINPDKPFASYLEARPGAAANTFIGTLVGTIGQTAGLAAIERLARDNSRAESRPGSAEVTATPVAPAPVDFGAIASKHGGVVEPVPATPAPALGLVPSPTTVPPAVESPDVPINQVPIDTEVVNAGTSAVPPPVSSAASTDEVAPNTEAPPATFAAVAQKHGGVIEQSASGEALPSPGVVDLDTPATQAQTSDRESVEPSEGAGIGQEGRAPLRRVAASEPTGAESPRAQTERRERHYRDVFAAVVHAARRLDPTVKPAKIRAEFEARISFLEDLDREFQESGHNPRTLLEAIARAGGISLDAEQGGGYTGELRRAREGAAGPYGNFGGVPNVFRTKANDAVSGKRKTGHSLDDMVRILNQDPEFSHIQDIEDLMAALDDVARMGDVGARGVTYPGTAELATRAKMAPDQAWWNDRWFQDQVEEEPAPEVATAEDEDDSFDVEAFERDLAAKDDPPDAVGEPRASYGASLFEDPGDTLDPNESDQDRGYREYAENFDRVSQDPQAATTKNLVRAADYAHNAIASARRKLARGALTEQQAADLIASLTADQQFFDRLVDERGDRFTSREDTLDTGEVQPRLPGAGAVREQDVKTPEFEAPFALTSEVSKAKKGRQDTLFEPATAYGDQDAPPRVERRQGFVTTDGRDSGLEAIADDRGGFSEDHNDTARRLLGGDKGIRDALNLGWVRYWVRRGEVALNLSANGPGATRRAIEFLRQNYTPGDRIYLDVEKGDTTVGKFFDNLREANTALRVHGGLATDRVGQPATAYATDQAQPAPMFYSKLRQVLEQKMPNRATPGQVLAIVTNSGVKAEEVQWSGLRQFLADKPTVTKADVLGFIDANHIQVQEVLLGETKQASGHRSVADIDREMDAVGEELEDRAGFAAAATQADYEAAWDANPDLQQRHRALQEERNRAQDTERGRPTKFATYVVPGGDNYRELLLTLPPKEHFDPANLTIERKRQSVTQGSVSLTYNGTHVGTFSDDIQLRDGRWQGHDDAHWQDVMRRRFHGSKELMIPSASQERVFTDGHFDEPNVLAHIRFNDRVDAQGRKVLFVEEIQSDWHQKGRRHGYRTGESAARAQELKRQREAAHAEYIAAQRTVGNALSKLDDLGFDSPGEAVRAVRDATNWRTDFDWTDAPEATLSAIDNMRRSWEAYGTAREAEAQGTATAAQVPDAPFKTTWPELAMKRMLRYAAEHGYDVLAWTTGEQQNERYDLSKHVSEIRYTKKADGRYRINAYDLEGRHIDSAERETATLDELEGLIGKDVATRIEAGDGDVREELSTRQLRERGRAIEAFTRQALGRPVWYLRFQNGAEMGTWPNKGAAEADAGRINDMLAEEPQRVLKGDNLKIGGSGMRGFYDDILPRFMDKYGKAWGVRTEDVQIKADNAPEDVVQRWAEKDPDHPFVKKNRTSVHGVVVTPAMRSAIMGGQALFQPKANYDRRPGTDRAKSERLVQGALFDLDTVERNAVSETRDGDRRSYLRPAAGLRGLGIRPDLINTQRLELRGRTLTNGAHDIAALAQVARDPRFETLRVVYVKKNADGHDAVLATEAISSRTPDAVAAFIQTAQERQFIKITTAAHGADRAKWPQAEQIRLRDIRRDAIVRFREAQRARMVRLGADGYYLIHNHPSGNAKPSQEDLNFTRYKDATIGGLRGHVVIDSGEYAVITPTGEVSMHTIDNDARLHAASVPHEVIGAVITRPTMVRDVGKRLAQPGGATFLFTTSDKRQNTVVRAIETVPYAMLTNPEVTGFMRRRRSAYGGAEVLIYLDETAPLAARQAAVELFRARKVLDVVTSTSSALTAGERRDDVAPDFPASHRVGEGERTYGKDDTKRRILLGDLTRVATRRRVSIDSLRKAAEKAGYTVIDEAPRPVHVASDREVPRAKSIPPERLLEFPSIQKMPEAIQGDIADLLAKYQGFEAQRRGVQPIARTQELAKDVWLPLETLKSGTALNAEELEAYKTALATALTERQTVLTKIQDGSATDWDRLQFSHLTDVATILTASYRGAKAETGRALNVLRVKARVLELQESQFLEAALRAPGFQKDLTAVSKAALEAAGDPLKQLQFLRARAEASWFDVFQAVYYANLLSGLKTHLRNAIGNSFNVLANTVTPVGAAAADVARTVKTGQARSVFLAEIPQNVIGGFIGLQRGWQNAAFTFSEGFRPSTVTAAAAGVFDTPRPELRGGLKNPFNWPSRSLEAADEFFRAIAFHQELYAGAYAAARREGVRGRVATSERMTELIARTRGPDASTHERLAAKADVFAARAVFQEEPGAIVQWLLKAKAPTSPRPLRLASLFIAPFIKTPSAILRQGFEWSPAGFVMKGVTENTGDDRAREQSQAAGRALLGTAFLLGPIAWLAATGRLTGAPPDDPGEREEFYAQGKLANAVRIGDYWVRYVLFQPFSVSMAAMANAWEKFNDSEQDEAAAEEAFMVAVAGAGASLLDQSFLSGLGTFIDAINEPKRYAGQWLNLFAQGFVPFSGLMRNITQAVDPVYRKPQGVAESVQAILPGQSSTLMPRRTRFGEEAKAQGSGLRRGFTVPEVSRAVDDEVTTTLARLAIRPTTPTGALQSRGEKVPLTRVQQDVLIEVTGREKRVAIERVLQGPGFSQLGEEQQRAVLRRTINAVSDRVNPRALAAIRARRPFTVDSLASPAVREQMRRDRAAFLGTESNAVAR